MNDFKIPPQVPDNLNSKKKWNYKSNQTGKRCEQRSNTNVAWVYNFDPLKKWITIILAAVCLVGSTIYLRQEAANREQLRSLKIEAKEARTVYLEKRLEAIKLETIAAEQRRIENQEKEKLANKEVKNPVQRKGMQVYTWLDENGQKVYSNHPQK